MDIDNALAKHSEWKVKLRSAILKQETLDAATISKDNRCELGKWLHGEAKIKFAELTSYSECLAKHAAFHTEAGKVASAINSKKYSEAETMLNTGASYFTTSKDVGRCGQVEFNQVLNGTSYFTASKDVSIALLRLKKEAGL